MALTKVIGAGLGTVTEDQVFGGATPTVTIGDAGAEDAKIVFDGNAQDYHIGLDDSADTLVIGKGSALGTTTAMSFDANGIITQPLQPAFMARPNTNQNNIATNATIVFGTEVFDQNGDFSSNTFTAPVTGRYQLDVTLRANSLDTAASYNRIYLVTSNRNYETIYDLGPLNSDPAYWNFNINVLADMDEGDTALVKWSQGGGGSDQADIGSVEASFSGYLVA